MLFKGRVCLSMKFLSTLLPLLAHWLLRTLGFYHLCNHINSSSLSSANFVFGVLSYREFYLYVTVF